MENVRNGLATGVLSGDTILIQGKEKEGEVPPCKELSLAYIEAPKMQTPHKKGDPFAFAARELVRKLIIGKKIYFTFEYKRDEKEYFVVWNEDPTKGNVTSISEKLVQEGLATVRGTSAGKHEEEEEEEETMPTKSKHLKDLQEKAKSEEKGIWSKDEQVLEDNTFEAIFPATAAYDHFKLQEAVHNDGDSAEGIVETISLPCCYNVLLPKYKTIIKLSLEYVHNPPGGPKATEAQQKVSRRAKAFAERLILHQNVTISLTTYEATSTSFFGRLFVNKDKDVACEMLANGYAKLPKQTGSMDPEYYAKLRIAMHQAQVGRKGLWKEESKGAETEEVKGANFSGRVTEIQSGDSLTVMNIATGEEKRFFLAGVRAPTLATKANPEKEQPYAWEAKEFVRKMVIGKTVDVEIEYTKVPGKPEDDPTEPKKPAMTFVNILFGGKCLNVEIVAAGLASVVNPPLDKVLSKYYGEMVSAAKKAKDAKKGINAVSNPPVHSFQDMYGQQNQKTIAYYQEFFKKNCRVTGMVEHCITGSRLKVRITEANCYIAFVCQGILPLPQDPNQPQIDKIFKQAQRFAKLNLLQRDVEIEILSSDKKSNFFGILMLNGQNYALSLLEEGLALVNYMPGRGPTVKRELYEQAEQKAKKAQKGIWDPNENISLELIRPAAAVFTPLEGKNNIEIVSYPNNNFFYAVNTDTTLLKKIEALMAKDFDPTKTEKLQAPIKKGTYCMALYSEDKKWYRGIIDRVISEESCSVLFIDYGNCEEVHVTGIRRLDQKFLKDLPAQAMKIGLAYIEMPTLDTEVGGKKLRNILQNLLDGKELVALYKYSDEGITYGILLQDTESDPMKSFNAYLLKRGYAKITKRVKFPEYLHEWKDIQDKASSEQEGFWATNELAEGSDDEKY